MNLKSKFEKYIIINKNKIKISSKDIQRGDVFLALQGNKIHGSKFIRSSISNGAKYCVTDDIKFSKNKKVIYVQNIIKYLTELAKIKRNLYRGKVIGITGSAGKTTLKETLAYFLNKKFSISYSIKSYNNELGVLISLLNLNLKSNYSIFEIGTNNFGEIKYLTKIVEPTEIFITNIQSTHLQNFKTKTNIAKEKSDIFIYKYNKQNRKLYLNPINTYENYIYTRANKEKKLKVVCIDKKSKKYFIKKIINKKNFHEVIFFINKKLITLEVKSLIKFRLINLLFCYAFFSENSINYDVIEQKHKNLKPVDGRGLGHDIIINKNKIKIIDESYNANPDTMYQSVQYFFNLKKMSFKKILILGDMNELGKNSDMMHTQLIKYVDTLSFRLIILCGEFMQRSIKKLNNLRNEFIILNNKNKIMGFLKNNVHNNDTILIKCSNSTEVNKFTRDLLKKGNVV